MSTANVEDIYELSPLQQGMLLHSLYDGAPTCTSASTPSRRRAVGRRRPGERLAGGRRGAPRTAELVLLGGAGQAAAGRPQDVSLPVHRHDWSGSRRASSMNGSAGCGPTTARPVSIPVAPLQRLHVIRLGDRRHSLIWTYHHVLMDGWSIQPFLDEVMARYRNWPSAVPAAARGRLPRLHRLAATQDLRRHSDLWTEALAGYGPPLSRSNRGTRSTAPGRSTPHVPLPESLTGGLRDAAARHRVTFSTLSRPRGPRAPTTPLRPEVPSAAPPPAVRPNCRRSSG